MKRETDSPKLEQLLNERETTSLCRVSVRGLIDWRNKGLVPYLRLGRSIRYRPESIRALLEKLEIGGGR